MRSKAFGRIFSCSFFIATAVVLWSNFSSGSPEKPIPSAISNAVEPVETDSWSGSSQCRSCHEKFYDLWATSHHGLAMQPFTADFARKNLTEHKSDIKIGKSSYRAIIAGDDFYIRETRPDGAKQDYPIRHIMGGKNVYYFLTPLEKGRLQTTPLSYDLNTKQWYDTAASAIRHFVDVTDEAIDWRDIPYTFNTSCYNCHVSQIDTNYDLKSDSYHTVWNEPGINCESCHGPAGEHIKICKNTPAGEKPAKLGLISTKSFTAEQHDGLCGPCHAKMRPISTTYKPGEHYFDHYDLTTLENRDFYPDGRDLGENYTFTLWRMSPCVKSGQLDCMHCHTSSGRYRFKDKNHNDACMPCHSDIVARPAAHSHHPVESGVTTCISCHMPMTMFARMNRSDHSMRSPSPSATMAFKSPNACNQCHSDQDAAWADNYVRKWYKNDYQAPILYQGHLVDDARKGKWGRLNAMLKYITDSNRDEIVATSLVRLMARCPEPRKWPVLRKLLNDTSPLVRSAAAVSLADDPSGETQKALLKKVTDAYRLVRIQAAYSLSRYPMEAIPASDRKALTAALDEYEGSLKNRRDDYVSHYNLGNYYNNRRQVDNALASYNTSIKLNPANLMPHVNASLIHAQNGDPVKAEKHLRAALKIEPNNVETNFNLALLLAEKDQMAEAEKCLRTALKADPHFGVAAYNLAVMVAGKDIGEAIKLSAVAAKERPDDPKYAYTHAFYLAQGRQVDKAIAQLKALIERHPDYTAAWQLLGSLTK